MTSFSYSTIIEAPIETVFDYVSNIDNRMEWQVSLVKVERLTPLPDGVGPIGKRHFNMAKKPQLQTCDMLHLSVLISSQKILRPITQQGLLM